MLIQTHTKARSALLEQTLHCTQNFSRHPTPRGKRAAQSVQHVAAALSAHMIIEVGMQVVNAVAAMPALVVDIQEIRTRAVHRVDGFHRLIPRAVSDQCP
jgi:hypothetical protein